MEDKEIIIPDIDPEELTEYEKQTWIDHIVDDETGIVKQRGTAHSQDRMNHLEDGIYNANKKGNIAILNIDNIKRSLRKLEDELSQYGQQTEEIQNEIKNIYEELDNMANNETMADLASRLKRLEDAVLSNITGNPFEISFKDLEGLKVTGIWNKEKQRLEV